SFANSTCCLNTPPPTLPALARFHPNRRRAAILRTWWRVLTARFTRPVTAAARFTHWGGFFKHYRRRFAATAAPSISRWPSLWPVGHLAVLQSRLILNRNRPLCRFRI